VEISLVILSAGNSTRFNSNIKKQWIRIDTQPLWKFVADRLNTFYPFKETIITANPQEIPLYQLLSDYTICRGGTTRQLSLKNALSHVNSEYVLVTDVARACVPKEVVLALINNIKHDCIVPYLPVVDTVVYRNQPINREEVKLIQTPQLSKTDTLKQALKTDVEYTDDSSAIQAIGKKVDYILGSKDSAKLTFGDERLPCLNQPSNLTFSGIGYDIHQLCLNKPMYLCGVRIDTKWGLLAHSDGDVAIHAAIDALLGACGYGDIGEFFPDNDAQFKDAKSTELLEYIVDLIYKTGYEIVNIDMTIIAQTPKLSPYKKAMRQKLIEITHCSNINIKATTNEKLDSIGEEKAIAVHCVANVKFAHN